MYCRKLSSETRCKLPQKTLMRGSTYIMGVNNIKGVVKEVIIILRKRKIYVFGVTQQGGRGSPTCGIFKEHTKSKRKKQRIV